MVKFAAFMFLFLFFAMQFSNAQSFKRKKFDYSKMQNENISNCDTDVLNELQSALIQIEQLQSEQAVLASEKIFQKTQQCPQIYEVYGWSLFRNGKWLEGLDIIEKGLDKFGSNPDLILRKGFMSLEMAELGVGQRNIDGNGVYLSKDRHLKYDEEQFKEENLASALSDFEYISTNYENRYQEIMITGYLYGKIKNYDKSNEYLQKLLEINEYKEDALMYIIDNYIASKNYTKAEKLLIDLLQKHPKLSVIHKKMYEVYQASGDKHKMEESQNKYKFFQIISNFSDIQYSKENLETLLFFAENNPIKEKENKLNDIVKNKAQSFVIDVCLSILKIHANHGNGIEEKATMELINFGNKSIPKAINMMENENVSTCTITNIADILASVKDTSGWQPLINYLPRMANLPFTVIPPNVPAKIMKFDKDKGARILISFIKKLIQTEQNTQKSDNPFDDLKGFGQNVFYEPLKELKKKEVIQIAKENNYSTEEIDILLKNIY